MKVRIFAPEGTENFIIEPLDFNLSEIRGLQSYVSLLNNGIVQDNQVIISTENTDVIRLYHKIKHLFEDRLNCELVDDKSSSSILSIAKNEEQKFIDFSRKARLIRNNEIEQSELNAFLNVIKGNSFIRTLKPFQILAAYHLAFSQNACNFSVPGSGKTTTVLAAYSYLKTTTDSDKQVDKLMVIGPLSSFLAWKTDYKECFGENPVVLEIKGGVPDSTIRNSLLISRVAEELILVSYDSVYRREEILSFFLKNNRTMLVLDEAHRIKNVAGGKRSEATLHLAPNAKSRVVLTGTPAPNNYVDVYNLYKFIWPSHNIIGYSPQQLLNMSFKENDARVDTLIDRMAPFFIRIKKKDLDLPKPTFHNPTQVNMFPLQQQIYNEISSVIVNKLENKSILGFARRAATIRLRQAASNPSLLSKAIEDFGFDYDEEDFENIVGIEDPLDIRSDVKHLIDNYEKLEVPAKFISAYNISKKIVDNKGKIIIWCEFIGTCESLSKYLTENGIANRLLYGKTPIGEREVIIQQFTDVNIPSSFNVIIANPHAVGESISLHQTCHNALYLEQSFNAGVYMQSKDRIHRVGLKPKDKINYYFLHSTGTVDQQVYDRVISKEEAMLELIESQEIPLIAQNVDFEEDNDDDIKAIIRGYYEYRNRL